MDGEASASYWKDRLVCVTGGTGLLGYQVVKCLLNVGASVRVLALPPKPGHPLVRESRVSLIQGDVRDEALVREALQGCAVVFHLAGVVAVWGSGLKAMREVHAQGTSHVLTHAPERSRVVVTSSVVAVGASIGQAELDETSPFNLGRLRMTYVHAKRAAENLAMDHAARGRDVVVTNPGYLVGPDDFERSVMGRFCVRYWRGQMPVAPPGGVNLVDVRDVALGHLLAAERGQAGRRYILGGSNLTFAEFMDALADAAGYRPRATPVLPYWGLAALAGCGEFRSALTRRHPYPSFQHAQLNRYHWFYRSDRAAAELGYQSRPLAATLEDTLRWYTSRKTLAPRGASRWWMRPRPWSVRAA